MLFETKPVVWGINDLEVDPEKVGLKGSPTQVKRTFTPPAKEPGRTISGPPNESVKVLIKELQKRHIL